MITMYKYPIHTDFSEYTAIAIKGEASFLTIKLDVINNVFFAFYLVGHNDVKTDILIEVIKIRSSQKGDLELEIMETKKDDDSVKKNIYKIKI